MVFKVVCLLAAWLNGRQFCRYNINGGFQVSRLKKAFSPQQSGIFLILLFSHGQMTLSDNMWQEKDTLLSYFLWRKLLWAAWDLKAVCNIGQHCSVPGFFIPFSLKGSRGFETPFFRSYLSSTSAMTSISVIVRLALVIANYVCHFLVFCLNFTVPLLWTLIATN